MLTLQSIILTQFRNYVTKQFSFTEKIVGIYGSNGTGKTNLLDAIYYLSFTKSYFARTDAQNVHHGLSGLRIEGHYEIMNEEADLICILRENNKKEFNINGEAYKKFSEHIGNYPCVMIAPDDVALISGNSEERRKFIDTILSQIDTKYLRTLIDYTKLLQQRNSFLKQATEQGFCDDTLLNILSEQLSEKGDFIFNERKKFIQHFIPLTIQYYQTISGNQDNINVHYESQLQHGEMKQLLAQSKHKDLQVQRTSVGIHKDDLLFQLNDAVFKNEASQGQRKSLLFALKMAEWQTLKNYKGFAPILLLDDVFEKLDEKRMFNLLHWVCKEDDAQVFITDTHQKRLADTLQTIGVKHQLIHLEDK